MVVHVKQAIHYVRQCKFENYQKGCIQLILALHFSQEKQRKFDCASIHALDKFASHRLNSI